MMSILIISNLRSKIYIKIYKNIVVYSVKCGLAWPKGLGFDSRYYKLDEVRLMK